jgi:predicted RNase H-like HicB family nuclease
MKATLRSSRYYTAVFQEEEGGGYSVTVPALPGCFSEGNTFEEAQANIQEAIELYVETAAEANLIIPDEHRPPVISSIPVRLGK